MSKIAILGLGAIGSRMTQNLLKAGHEVFVYNRTAERVKPLETEGAKRVNSPREAAEQADTIISMVTDDDASHAIWLDEETGALGGLDEGSIAIESSTLTPGWVHQLAEKITATGAEFLDAPVVGSRPQAEAGQLTYLVGGSEETLNKVHNILSAMGGAIHYIGPVGSGMVMKLAVNATFGVQVAAFAEILGMVRKSGVDLARAVEVLGGLPTTSPALKMAMGHITSRTFAPLFPINLVEKDFRYVVESSKLVNAPLPTSSAVWDVFAEAKRKGYGDDNISGVAQLFD